MTTGNISQTVSNRAKWRYFFVLLKRFVPPMIIYAFIFYLSSRPASSFPDMVPDVVPHFLEYALLGYFFIRIWQPAVDISPAISKGRTIKIISFSFVLLVLLAFLDELHQYFVPTRFFEIKDLVVDSMGSGMGIWFHLLTHRKN